MADDITLLLQEIERGDRQAAGRLLPLVYEELRRLAARKMAREASEQTLQPTALVHEAFLRLVGERDLAQWDGREHFFMAAAEAMRRILIESARRRKAAKRGGEMARCEIRDEDIPVEVNDADQLIALDEALTRLAEVDADLARLVQLRYFTGLTIEETARVLKTSPRTTKRHWAYARAWLRREIEGNG
ncbi:ECF-type sigma factor [Planctomycetes bacterium Pan216]